MPLVSPLIVQDVAGVAGAIDVDVQVWPPLEVTVYLVMVAPPLFGAVQDTTDCAFTKDVPDTAVGAPGIVAAVTGDEAAEEIPVPATLEAVTVKL